MEKGDYHYDTAEPQRQNFKELWEAAEERRNAELIPWLDEFLASEEFAERMRRKRRCVDKCTVVTELEFQCEWDGVEEEQMPKKYRHTVLLYEKLQNALKRENVRNTVTNQKLGIKIIRAKIAEAKYFFKTRKLYNERCVEQEREDILKILRTEYDIDLPSLTTKSKIVDRALLVRKRSRENRERKQENILHIVKKILHDAKRDAEIAKAQTKTYDYKVVPQERIVKDMEIFGTKIVLSPRPKKKPYPAIEDVEDGDESPKEEVVEEKGKVEKKKDKKKKGAKGKKDKKSGKSKKSKGKSSSGKSKGKKDKKSKKSKGTKSLGEQDLILPVPPITNKRGKLKAEQGKMTALLDDFCRLEKYLTDKWNYAMEQKMESSLCCEEDCQVFSTPEQIIFKDFVNGQTYKKRVTLTNGASYAKKLRFDRIIWSADIDDELLLEIDPIGIQKLYPGLGCHIRIHFNPETLKTAIEAKILFVTYKPSRNKYKQFVLHVICTPHCADVIISPLIIAFEEIPIWRAAKLKAERKNYKTLKITNRGIKQCRVVITKMFAPGFVEQAWRNIVSIMAIDDEPRPIRSKEFSSEEANLCKFPRNLVQECVENVFNIFRFERMILNIPGRSEKLLKVSFVNLESTGYHVEMYLASVYQRYPDEKLYCIGTQDIVVSAETTGHFLQLDPDILDFEVCVLGSVYQLSFEVGNPTNLPHKVRIRFPSRMKDYLSCTINDITVQAGKRSKVFIKFLPRRGIIEENAKFYDLESELLEFPIYVCVYTLGYEDTPHMCLDAFAAVTEPLGLILKPTSDEHCEILNGEYVLDVGSCTTSETLCTDIELYNSTLVPQHYGFLDLPQCITIHPNFGFGYLMPMERTIVRLYFSPEKRDLDTKLVNEDSETPGSLFFHISVNTVKNLGAVKKSTNYKKIGKELKKMEHIIANPPPENKDLMRDIGEMMGLLRGNHDVLTPVSTQTGSSLVILDENTVPKTTEALEEYAQSFLDDEKVLDVVHYDKFIEDHGEEMTEEESEKPEEPFVKSNRIWIRAQVSAALGDFSHQYVNFPETPCGSYSVMNLEFRALKNLLELKPGKKLSRPYKAHFEITGNSDEISIEPTVGDLRNGEKMKIYLVAKPQIPQHIIEEKARAIKVAELIEKKRKEMEELRLKKLALSKAKASKKSKKGKKDEKPEKASKKKGGKPDKKSKDSKKKGESDKSSASTSPEREPEIIIDDKDVIVGYFDYYPAEMCVWRSLEPYFIKAEFCCTVTYTNEKFKMPSDKLYLRTVCRVTQPQFIHDLKIQEIDFGKTAIGMNARKVINLQNIETRGIYPKINALCPLGGYSTIELRNQFVPPEYILHIPITFTPLQERHDIEFFEIVSNRTTYPFVLKAEGVTPVFSFSTDFTICRLEANRNGSTECSFEVQNEGLCPITICLSKVCELEGKIQDKPVLIDTKTKSVKGKKDKKSKKGKSEKSSSKKSKGKEKKRPKFSKILMEDEEYSMENFFEPRKKEKQSFFKVLGNGDNPDSFFITPESKCTIKVRFGYSPPPPKEKGKGKKGKKGNKGSKSSKASKSSKGTKSSGQGKKGKADQNQIYYVAKYNLTLGRRTYLKDIVVIGCFK